MVRVFGLVAAMWPASAMADASNVPGLGFLMLKSVMGLAGVLALFAFGIWLVRRFQPGLKTTGGNILVLEKRLSIDGKNAVAVIRYGCQRWLIGLSPSGLTRIDQLEAQTIDDQAQKNEGEP